MPGDLFVNPLYQNQYDFVDVKTFKAGKDIPKHPLVFLEADNKTFLMQKPTYTQINFDQKWVKNLIDTFVNIIQSKENVFTVLKNDSYFILFFTKSPLK